MFIVNPSHALNRRRLAWWLVRADFGGGGRTWSDLMGPRAGTLTNMAASSGLGWQATTRPGGWGHVLGNGSNAQVVAPLTPIGINNFTLAAWARFDSASLKGAILKVGDNTTGCGIGVGSGTYDTNGNGFVALNENVAWLDSAKAIGTGWHRLLFATSDATRAYYIDGVQVFSAASAAAFNLAASNTYILGYTGSGSEVRYFNGPVDDVSVWGRTLAAGEAAADYDLSRRGYPGVLLRSRPRVATFLPPAAPTGRVGLIGPGLVGSNPLITYGSLVA